MIRSTLFTRSALGLALALGVVAGTCGAAAPAMAKEKAPAAPKLAPSKGFASLYNPTKSAILDAAKRADVVEGKAAVASAAAAVNAASGKAARTAARANYDGAVNALIGKVTGEKATLDKLAAAATTADDRYLYGQLALELGKIAEDKALQRTGIKTMVDSGKLAADQVGLFNYFAGAISYDMRDWAGAREGLHAAIAAGFTQNDAESLLAEAYFNDNKAAEGLDYLQSVIAARAGKPVPEEWLRRGISVAYTAKLSDKANAFGTQLVMAYPTTKNWALAIAVLRDTARYPSQEMLDLLRLMDRTNSYLEGRDYVEYIQAADPRRSPGEVMKVLNAGLAAGKLTSGDVFVNEAKTIAGGRLTADKASLAGLERDARAPAATAVVAMAAADAYLSYDNPGKAAELYQIALSKPGVDTARALTRLGIAQTDLGQIDAAKATFAKVSGVRKGIADLWTAYAASKAAPAS